MTRATATLWVSARPAARPLHPAFAILGGALLIALATRVQVPMWPVPMTLQTLAVLLVAMTCGARLAVGAVLAYLAQGAMGLPVFAAGGGLAPLVGPTAGYLWGFVLVAWVVGSLADRGLARGFAGAFGLALLGSALVYVVGASWLAGLIGAQAAWTAGVLPFLAGDLVKSALAALLVPMGWRLLARRP